MKSTFNQYDVNEMHPEMGQTDKRQIITRRCSIGIEFRGDIALQANGRK
jgi:hypothetical protein